ncbi:MAG TPA: AAA family ATPase [Hanamia sp.]|nr:AAA family ATPase [Hanamia sp.]
MIVIVFGLPGSGKSYFASRLAKMIHADYINSDKVRKEMFEKRVYSEKEKKAVYNAMLQQLKEAIGRNKNVVLDATFHKKETRRIFIEAVSGKKKISFIQVQADENIIKERLKKPRPYSEAGFEVYKLIKQQNEPIDEPHLILKSTNDNIDEMLQKASEFLKIKK